MSEHDIQFGDMEQAGRQRQLPPNRNKQYAVAACGRPGAEDLRIFVDLDALRDMETHALSDTHVELGGVLLGGQYQDESGEPFVVVQDSLRAEHFEATRGSFKFTHDTWSEISRRRDEFPDDLHMVGWYHTHPDWGVFLSGMDLFICEHFFRGELDVALVIDPCRGDRGWFQWTGRSDDRIRQTEGFYVYASRHRAMELELFAAHLEKRPMTINEPGLGRYPATITPFPVTAAAGFDTRGPWLAVAVLGILAAQFFLLALLAWRTLAPEVEAIAGGPAAPPVLVDNAASRATTAAGVDQLRSREIETQRRVLEHVVGALRDGGPENLVQLLEETERENLELKADARVYRSLEARTATENETLTRLLDVAKSERLELNEQIQRLQTEIADQELAEDRYRREIAALREDQEASRSAAGQLSLAARFRDPLSWLWAAAGALVGALVAVGVVVFRAGPSGEAASDDFRSDESPDDAATGGKDDPAGTKYE
jgi:proteasome lid subunit RPN8/RPN11